AVTHPFTFLRAELRSLTLSNRNPLYQHGVIPAVKIDDPLNKPPINRSSSLKTTWNEKMNSRAEAPLQLVADLPQEFLPHFDVRLGLDHLGPDAVDDAQDAAALLPRRHHDFH